MNGAPVAQAVSAAVKEGSTLTLSPPAGDVDSAASSLSVGIVIAPLHGSVVVNADGAVSHT